MVRWAGKERGHMYRLDTSEAQQILDSIEYYRLPRWGFVVLRCTYGDDAAWARLMARLESIVREMFSEQTSDEVEVVAKHEWTVVEHPDFEGMPKDQLRERFGDWAGSAGAAEYVPMDEAQQHELLDEVPRYSFCLAIDKASLDSVLADEGKEFLGDDAYVNVIRADDDWYHDQKPIFSTYDWSQQPRASENERQRWDEGAAEIEGCRLRDVGWMRYRLRELFPDLWLQTAEEPKSWRYWYVRPDLGKGPYLQPMS